MDPTVSKISTRKRKTLLSWAHENTKQGEFKWKDIAPRVKGGSTDSHGKHFDSMKQYLLGWMLISRLFCFVVQSAFISFPPLLSPVSHRGRMPRTNLSDSLACRGLRMIYIPSAGCIRIRFEKRKGNRRHFLLPLAVATDKWTLHKWVFLTASAFPCHSLITGCEKKLWSQQQFPAGSWPLGDSTLTLDHQSAAKLKIDGWSPDFHSYRLCNGF